MTRSTYLLTWYQVRAGSTDLCGRFLSVDGHDMGPSDPAHLYTVGQGAKIGGMKGKWFVVSTNVGDGTVVIAEGTDHPALFAKSFRASPVTWISGNAPAFPLACR